MNVQSMPGYARIFTILAKYSQDSYATSAEHDVIYIHVDPAKVTDLDVSELEGLGCHVNEKLENFTIYT